MRESREENKEKGTTRRGNNWRMEGVEKKMINAKCFEGSWDVESIRDTSIKKKSETLL